MQRENKKERIHFIGVGGISMSSLAAIAQSRGNVVSGSDHVCTPLTEHLRLSGVDVSYEHKAENVKNADRVVYTAAISEDNPEYAEAKRRGVPLVKRSVYLGEIMRSYPVRIGVSGTHGKSSTTGMLSNVFLASGSDPTVACGAVIKGLDSAYRLGTGEHFIYEACEYTDSFLDFFPSIALVLNIELDHVDYFKTIEQLRASFRRSISGAGAAVVNWDDPNVRIACASVPGVWLIKTGIEREDLDYRAVNLADEGGRYSFDLMKENEYLGRASLSVPGRHHVYNALCAAAAADICGIPRETIVKGLDGYQGVKRRFDYVGTYGGADIYDDYAHHPTEIRATLQTAREMCAGRVFCVFQPHTFSRTLGLFSGFVDALSMADKLYLAPIYAAREPDTNAVSSEQLAAKIKNAETIPTFEEIAERLKKELRPGDMLLTMGAGCADRVGRLILNTDRN